jgi:hypothetical protein
MRRGRLIIQSWPLHEVPLDAQLSPALCQYIADRFTVEVNRDLLELSRRHGPPPQVVWIRSGNTSNAILRRSLNGMFPDVLRLLSEGEAIVELRGIIEWAVAPEAGKTES